MTPISCQQITDLWCNAEINSLSVLLSRIQCNYTATDYPPSLANIKENLVNLRLNFNINKYDVFLLWLYVYFANKTVFHQSNDSEVLAKQAPSVYHRAALNLHCIYPVKDYFSYILMKSQFSLPSLPLYVY